MSFSKLHPFEERAVAFLDVLGFTQLIKDAEIHPHRQLELFGIIASLDGHVKYDNRNVSAEVPDPVKPKYIFISDSIIFSAPLRHGTYDGLGIIVAKTIQIAHKLMQMGHLLQAGINVGSVWHTGSNIFGTGYIDAYKTQAALTHPQAILTDAAAAHWQSDLASKVPQLCFLDTDGKLNADILNPNYLDAAITHIHGGVENQFTAYRVWITTNQAKFAGTSPGKKWDWAANYFNETLKRHGINVPPI
ncbi:hypothetical protein [Bradyrhizobium sp.]|uniref:hypothetical protein n=1 Tax=Bradyrhizobium sp. TaxID=376 RepID=UPI001ED21C52|nr:hypothetical protein [Bradyrhizobium sp.]MBV9484350.1 hypothetical protein [Acidobacteriota bacterium]MBV9984931.1 hypothetical protein [Bradyrhizobium sp.]